MATRRQKLCDIYAAAASRGESAQDLYDSIESFTAAGNSGIETYLEWAPKQGVAADPCEDKLAEFKAQLKSFVDSL